MNVLNQSDSVPLYKQLKDIIKTKIMRGELKPNERIPSELELSENYNVSRITIRNAINELVEENLLIKKQGKGTFVCGNKIERNIARLMGFTEICNMSGLKASSEILFCGVVDATQRDIEILKLQENERVISIQRVRYADDVPVILEHVRFPSKYSYLMLEDLKNGSIYHLLREKYKVQLQSSRKSIEMTFATDKQASLLKIAKGYPMILISGFVLDDKDMPVHYTDQYIVGDKFKLII